MERQQTIANPVSLEGRGLFLGEQAKLTFKPAPANHGVVFVRTDLDGARVPALVSRVVKRPRRTARRLVPARRPSLRGRTDDRRRR